MHQTRAQQIPNTCSHTDGTYVHGFWTLLNEPWTDGDAISIISSTETERQEGVNC